MHKNAHNQNFVESRGDLLISRGVHIFSAALGVTGACDVLEFHRSPAGVPLHGREGLWSPYPVEYKRGAPRSDNADAMQLCGQAICLEEMLCCDIPEGALYFGETRRRVRVDFTDELRGQVRDALREMHALFRRGYTPKAKPTKSCGACSLKERCLPKLTRARPASEYLAGAVNGE